MESTGPGTYPNEKTGRRESRGFSAKNRNVAVSQSGVIEQDTKATQSKKYRVQVSIFGQRYTLVGEEPPERVLKLADIVDKHMNEIAQHSKGISTLKIAILAALNIADEVLRNQEMERVLADKGGRLISMLDGVVLDG